MLEFGNASPAPAADLIKDTTEATFMADVIEESQNTPVIVDFWAPWCGPCKTLGPALEAAVTAAGGKVKMVKVDVDQNQGIAGQLRVQSIPTVYAFYQGQPVDGFQGAVPPSEIEEFVKRVAALNTEDGGLEEAIAAADEMLEAGEAADAAQIFAAILEEDPTSGPAFGGLLRAHMALDELDVVESLLANVRPELANSAEAEAARAQIALHKQAADAGPVAELRAVVEAEPDNHQARFDLATALHAAGEVEEAVNVLLELFRRDREWDNGAAKAQLFTIFDALQAKDPIVLNGRRKLSSMIFA